MTKGIPEQIEFRANGDANSYAMINPETNHWWMALLCNGEQAIPYQVECLRRLAACWNLLHEFDTEAIEAGTFADFIGQQVYMHEIENANSGELRLSDVSMQLMAAGFAGKMKANAAENYMEFGLFHPETGHITLTVQRAEGLTPAQKLAAMTKQRDVLLEALELSLAAMEHMGNSLNEMDAVTEEDEVHYAAFEQARAAIAIAKGE